jgi:uncharacterized Ntn-hydrolase superfamily protein
VKAALGAPEVASVLVPREELLSLDLTELTVWLGPSRRTRSWPATSTRASGASRRSRSSSPSARSCPGPSRRRAPSRRSPTRTRATGRTGSRCSRRALGRGGRRALTEADEGRDQRQLGVVDAQGAAPRSPARRATTGRAADRAGYAAQGNILVSGETVDALAETFEAAAGRSPSGCSTPRGAQAAGGDSRGSSRPRCSSSSGTAATRLSDILVDLRVDDHEAPIEELRRLYGLHQQLFGTTPRDSGCRSTTSCAPRSRRLARLGYERLEDWAGAANLEERVDGDAEIDPVVLDELRRSDERLRDREPDGDRVGAGPARCVDAAAQALRDHGLRDQRLHGGRGGQDVVEEHDEDGSATRRSTSSCRAGDVRARRRGGDVPAGSAVFLRDPKVKRYARAEEPARRCSRSAASRAARVSGVGVLLRAYRSATRDTRGARRDRRGLEQKPGTRRCSTTWPAS